MARCVCAVPMDGIRGMRVLNVVAHLPRTGMWLHIHVSSPISYSPPGPNRAINADWLSWGTSMAGFAKRYKGWRWL